MVDEEVIKEGGKNSKESQKRGEICVVSLKRSHVIEVEQEERCPLNIRLPPLLFPPSRLSPHSPVLQNNAWIILRWFSMSCCALY